MLEPGNNDELPAIPGKRYFTIRGRGQQGQCGGEKHAGLQGVGPDHRADSAGPGIQAGDYAADDDRDLDASPGDYRERQCGDEEPDAGRHQTSGDEADRGRALRGRTETNSQQLVDADDSEAVIERDDANGDRQLSQQGAECELEVGPAAAIRRIRYTQERRRRELRRHHRRQHRPGGQRAPAHEQVRRTLVSSFRDDSNRQCRGRVGGNDGPVERAQRRGLPAFCGPVEEADPGPREFEFIENLPLSSTRNERAAAPG